MRIPYRKMKKKLININKKIIKEMHDELNQISIEKYPKIIIWLYRKYPKILMEWDDLQRDKR